MKARLLIPRILFVLLALLPPSIWAQDGLVGAFSRLGHATGSIRPPFGQGLVAADFDNDNRPDGAVLLDAGQVDGQKTFRIELHLTTGRNSQLTFASDEHGLAVSALDVNQDGVPDIVVEQLITGKRLHVWLNDGHGTFRKVQVNDFPVTRGEGGQFEARSPVGTLPTLYLPSRTGFQLALSQKAPLRSDSPSSGRYLSPITWAASSTSDAPNPPRGPPSFMRF